MKRTVVFLSLVCSLFVLSTAFSGCSMTPDMMLQEYNGKLYEDIGGGIYITDGKPNIMTSLLPRDVYRVLENGTLRFEEARAYFKHKWVLKDNTENKEYNIGDFYIAYVGRPEIDLRADHKYTLSLYVENRNGVLFMDSATILVVK